uniref:Ankyrin n=1 Tax=uncultured bacterium 5H7 TaxID=1701327 RepID=A0A0N9HUB8_9BACT|nr:ankyrin [uncultured bacterium 5H7]
MSKLLAKTGIAFLAAAGVMTAAAPALAQYSQGYKFLEAIRKKDGTVVEEMLQTPGTTVINTRDVSSGEAALHIVTARRDLTWLTFLLAKGANANVRNSRGVTPLQLAVGMGFVEGVELLLAKGARTDEPDGTGETPLIAAVHRRDTGIMRLLLKAGANPDRADNSGRSARDYAALEGRGNPLLAEIETSAKPKAAQGQSRGSYGPSF